MTNIVHQMDRYLHCWFDNNTTYCIVRKVGGHYIWWSLYLPVIIFGGIHKNCLLKTKIWWRTTVTYMYLPFPTWFNSILLQLYVRYDLSVPVHLLFVCCILHDMCSCYCRTLSLMCLRSAFAISTV